jgi:hypothetical protein
VRFLAYVELGLHTRDAADAAKVHFTTVYRRRKEDAAFRLAWDKAEKVGTEMLEDEAVRRAYHGVLTPVYYNGKVCGQTRNYSDKLLIFLLRSRLPKKYRDIAEF